MSTERFQGDPIAPGFAVGQLHLLEHDVGPGPPPPARVADPAAESDRFRRHVDALARQIEDAAVRLEAQTLGSEAEILRTHVLVLRDPELHRQVVALIEAECHRAEIAVQRVLDEMSSLLGAAEDPVLAERASDLRDLSRRLAAELSDQLPIDIATLDDRAEDILLVLPELLPSVVLEAREQGVVAPASAHDAPAAGRLIPWGAQRERFRRNGRGAQIPWRGASCCSATPRCYRRSAWCGSCSSCRCTPCRRRRRRATSLTPSCTAAPATC
jgi:phosphoenolpyruvate-protein kinase (PTS system EI component)